MATVKNCGVFRAQCISHNTTKDGLKSKLDSLLGDELEEFSLIHFQLVPACNGSQAQVAIFRYHPRTATRSPQIPSFLATPEPWFHLDGNDVFIDTDFYGLTQLFPVNPNDVKIDIVAISGLNSHAFGSWTSCSGVPENDKMWLSDFISKDEILKDSRVMTFGYDTKYRSKKQMWIEDHGDSFLTELDKARKTPKERDRPLVIIGHSFGGTIVTHAYVRSSEKTELEHIYNSITDIFLFGVPFQGINLDDVRSMVEEISDPTGQGEKMIDYGDDGNRVNRPYRFSHPALRELHITDPRLDKERIESTKGGLFDDSYKWILDNPDFKKWRNDDQYHILWISGDPGKGKTMLLCGIVNELRRDNSAADSFYLSYFFCQGTDVRINNATAVLRGLIFSLILQDGSLGSHIQQVYDQVGQGAFEGINSWFQLSKVFDAILSDLIREPTNTVYLVIDALDECVSDLEKLLDLISKFVSTSSSPQIKWIVSSRNWSDIERKLALPASIGGSRLSLELNSSLVSRAVEAYIGDQVLKLWPSERDEEFRNQVCKQLVEQADGTFLWVSLVVKDLEELQGTYQYKKTVLKKLREIPSGLPQLYGLMMQKIKNLRGENPRLCLIILSTMAIAYRPLQLAELTALTELESDPAEPDMIDALVKDCGSFLTVRQNTIYFVHQSAKDFLLEENSFAAFFRRRPKYIHYSMFSYSLQVMSKSLRKNIYSLPRPDFEINNDLRIPKPDPLASVRPKQSMIRQQNWGEVSPWINNTQAIQENWDLCLQTFDEIIVCSRPRPGLEAQPVRILGSRSSKPHEKSCFVTVVFFSPDGKLLAFQKRVRMGFDEFDESCSLWDVGMGKLQAEIRLGKVHKPQEVIISPDGRFIASVSYFSIGGGSGGIALWNTTTGALHTELVETGWMFRNYICVCFSPDSKFIAYFSQTYVGLAIKIWDIATKSLHAKLSADFSYPSQFTFIVPPDGKFLALLKTNYKSLIDEALDMSQPNDIISRFHYTIQVLSTDKGALLAEMVCHGTLGAKPAFAFSPDGRLLAYVSSPSIIKLWDAIMKIPRGELKDSLQIESFSISPSNELLACCLSDHTISLWNLATETLQARFQDHSASISSISFSPDSALLASSSKDGFSLASL
ncbi:hypothetical protein TWF191_004967 [Orbilia oligospora]|uniref:NACHT domain-containing protein n=1 Tax=Orbilia oligospora TaxID=2813651 RepID=A0A7C8QTI7_ORBOL|nr:hypothetical protein TWF191_004967 [Orbilia oligospora]